MSYTEFLTRTQNLGVKDMQQHFLLQRFLYHIMPTTLSDGEQSAIIRHLPGKDFAKRLYFRNVTELICYILKYRYYYNVYLALSTHVGSYNGDTAARRRCIAIDVEREFLPKKEENYGGYFYKRVGKQFGIDYHYVVCSGHGAHFYILIEETTDIKRVVAVTKALSLLMRGDQSVATKSQTLRVPLSFNLKDSKKKKLARFLSVFDSHAPYAIDYLWELLGCTEEPEAPSYDGSPRVPNKRKSYDCVRAMLERGGEKGDRNYCLGRIAFHLQHVRGLSEDETLAVLREWNDKCDPPKPENELLSQYKHWMKRPYSLLGCKPKNRHHSEVLAKFCTHCCRRDMSAQYKSPEGRFTLYGEHMTDELFAVLNGNDFYCPQTGVKTLAFQAKPLGQPAVIPNHFARENTHEVIKWKTIESPPIAHTT